MKLIVDDTRLFIFHEGRKRRIFVAQLYYSKEKNHYELIYDDKYMQWKKAIPLGQNLGLLKKRHISPKGKLFSSLLDRLPQRENPAYEDYCKSQGISPSEKNQIILLGTIGRRGPSSFIFEPVYKNDFSRENILKFRKELNLTRYDLAMAFDISVDTLKLIESGKSQDPNTMRRLQIYIDFPQVALWQLQLTGFRIHEDVLKCLVKHFKAEADDSRAENRKSS
jgi:DNA-binding XRE family transcriptional regulator